MSEEAEDIELVLSCRGYLYEMFRVLLGAEPDKSLIEIITSNQTKQSLMLAVAEYNPETMSKKATGGSQLEALIDFLVDLRQADARYLEELKTEYMKFLAGPTKGEAQPWESVYTSHRHLLFQESTLRVRNFYREHACLPEQFMHVADDHVALECGFMAVLCKRALTAFLEKDEDGLCRSVEGQRRFLDEHMLVWVPVFAEKISERAGNSLYQLAVRALSELCQIDKKVLNCLEVAT